MGRILAEFTVYGRLDGLNEYTKACRTNRFAGAKMKNKNEQIIRQGLRESSAVWDVITSKVHITYKWYEQTKRRDLDNIAFAKKFIQDTLVKCGVLEGDGWRHIAGFTDEFYIDKYEPRVEVVIREA